MKRLLQIIFAVIVVTQTAMVATAEEKKAPLKYVDALDFRMINKGFDDTETPYKIAEIFAGQCACRSLEPTAMQQWTWYPVLNKLNTGRGPIYIVMGYPYVPYG